MVQACAHTLQKLTETLFASGGFGGGNSQGDLNQTQARPGETVDSSPSKFSYTVLAAKRAEHRKLHHFIRLTDYIIRDTLHAMVSAARSRPLLVPRDCSEQQRGRRQ